MTMPRHTPTVNNDDNGATSHPHCLQRQHQRRHLTPPLSTPTTPTNTTTSVHILYVLMARTPEPMETGTKRHERSASDDEEEKDHKRSRQGSDDDMGGYAIPQEAPAPRSWPQSRQAATKKPVRKPVSEDEEIEIEESEDEEKEAPPPKKSKAKPKAVPATKADKPKSKAGNPGRRTALQ
ncbi:hypothetical protein CPB83DRAFT_840945 [Crepidotus variabilis]|uniref:Uncharacterized protein n=1 Tax=Crepidotus variabilis TaxID=179855 RepID=A0A9P6E3I4_9AGAR|nr:hypothetical protein CPB83DRAFT_840945 [Crepidotus variabilis]